MIRVAAVGDVHYGRSPRSEMRAHFEALSDRADVLLIAGDLTQAGNVHEAKALAEDLKYASIPTIAVLGNHDYNQNRQDDIRNVLRDVGVITLEGESTVIQVGEQKVGIAGIKGFGGGFFGACCTEFGEPEMKSFARHARMQADTLRRILENMKADYRFALMHFSPIEETLRGEKPEIFPFLGSYLLGEAIDAAGADAVFHGHAHLGREKGATAGGIPVRNVAQPVIRHSYNIYMFHQAGETGRASPGIRAEIAMTQVDSGVENH